MLLRYNIISYSTDRTLRMYFSFENKKIVRAGKNSLLSSIPYTVTKNVIISVGKYSVQSSQFKSCWITYYFVSNPYFILSSRKIPVPCELGGSRNSAVFSTIFYLQSLHGIDTVPNNWLCIWENGFKIIQLHAM